jgi:hypothetical protein
MLKHRSILMFLFAILTCVTSFGVEVTVDFEDLSLAPETDWVGPDPTGVNVPGDFGTTERVGQFISHGVDFTNRYNLDWFTWSRFAYSNRTDNTTPGFGNQVSAFTGTGFGPGNDNYSVAFGYTDLVVDSANDLESLPHLKLPSDASATGGYFTNTTYPALIMRDGDPNNFAKKFGLTKDGSGNIISTDDPDWFKLTVYGTDSAGTLLPNSVELYLADYRFADGSLDYILDEWTFLDLSPLANAEDLYFNLSSSDVGAFGMNTPAFFAMDNLILQVVPEPTTTVLILCAAAGLLIGKRRSLASVTRSPRS